MAAPVFGRPSFPLSGEKISNLSVKKGPEPSSISSSDDCSTDRPTNTDNMYSSAGFTNWTYTFSPYWNFNSNPPRPPPDLVARHSDANPLVRPPGLRYSNSTRPAFALRDPMAPAFDPTPEIREPGYSHLSCCAPHSRDQEDLSSFKKPEESTIAPTTSIPSQVQPGTLGYLNLGAVKDNHILLYYGVLAIQTLLLPRFTYHRTRTGKLYAVTLTMYGQTYHRNSGYVSKMKAKVEVCRVALEKLKSQHVYWITPDEPTDNPSSTGNWDWVGLLKDHCIQNGLPLPDYTKVAYDKTRGYSYQISLQRHEYSSPVRKHASDLQARNMAAHRALRDMLVFRSGESCQISAHNASNNTTENLLAQIPRAPPANNVWNGASHHEPDTRSMQELHRASSEVDHSSQRAKRRRTSTSIEASWSNTSNRTPRGNSSNQAPGGNSNLLPISNRRLTAVDLPTETESVTRWKVTPREIVQKLDAVETSVERMNKLCDLLSLEVPELRVERVDGRLIDTEGLYNAAAYFHDDPFFARAGAIGRVDKLLGTKSSVTGNCAENVVQYILGVAEEDFVLERENRAKLDEINQWMAGA